MWKKVAYIITFTGLLLTSCTKNGARYKIGVSQCSEDIWREKQNSELRMGAYFHDDVELCFAAAYDSDERQVQQIDSLVKAGIDLLIVAPNQVQTISPAIDRAFDKGIPVIVFERKTSSQKYTAFISADNYEMGRVMGEHIAHKLGGRGRVMEVMGLKGSSPAIERHKGFADAIALHPGIEVVATLQGDWTEESAYEAALKYQGALHGIDYVFAQNDRMAMGVRRAVANSSHFTFHSSLTKYCGIDGLPGEGGGIQLVRDSVLDATYIYPTHGDQILELALDILKGRPYEKESKLMSALVTSDNARVIQMQADETIRQTAYLDQLHERADTYLQQLSTQRTITLLVCVVAGLLLLTIVLYYLYHRGKITLRRERVVNNLWNIEEPTQSSLSRTEEEPKQAQGQKPSEQPSHSEVKPEQTQRQEPSDPPCRSGGVGGGLFLSRFKEAVEARLSDSELSVEDLAADMNLSRVQLYRKVKSVTGSSPVELLRAARLNRGYQMLLTTDKSISEVAYAVGFTAPSYFTKCFREEFGQSPTDIRQ